MTQDPLIAAGLIFIASSLLVVAVPFTAWLQSWTRRMALARKIAKLMERETELRRRRKYLEIAKSVLDGTGWRVWFEAKPGSRKRVYARRGYTLRVVSPTSGRKADIDCDQIGADYELFRSRLVDLREDLLK